MSLKNVKLVFEKKEKMQVDIRKEKYNSMRELVNDYASKYNVKYDIAEFIVKKALQNMIF